METALVIQTTQSSFESSNIITGESLQVLLWRRWCETNLGKVRAMTTPGAGATAPSCHCRLVKPRGRRPLLVRRARWPIRAPRQAMHEKWGRSPKVVPGCSYPARTRACRVESFCNCSKEVYRSRLRSIVSNLRHLHRQPLRQTMYKRFCEQAGRTGTRLDSCVYQLRRHDDHYGQQVWLDYSCLARDKAFGTPEYKTCSAESN